MQLLQLESYKRTTELYLRALWGRGFTVVPADFENTKDYPLSFVVKDGIHLAQSVSVSENQKYYYRAAAAHAALHISSRLQPFDRADLNLMQRSLVGLVEDLRLELLAINQFPGLRALWLDFHHISETAHVSALQLILRLSRSVLDPMYQDNHHWVIKGRKKILEAFARDAQSDFALELGLALANDLGQMRLPLNSGRYEQVVAYRDDNRCLWYQIQNSHQQTEMVSSQDFKTSHQTSLIEADTGMQLELADMQPKTGQGFQLVDNDAAVLEYRQSKQVKTRSTKTYSEWDYRIHRLKQDWCELEETVAESGELSVIEEIAKRHRIILHRLRRMATSLRVEKQQWLRKMEEGDQFDLDFMVDAMVAVRGNRPPDLRVYMRSAYQKEKNLAISILLDLSESTNEQITGTEQTVSAILRESVYLLGETLSTVGDTFSIAGFSSNGRQQVHYSHFKYFNETFAESMDRLSGIRGSYSTRLGAAIRHCASDLALRPERKKLLLVITDGSPSDIDVYDEHYLVHDSWHAVHELYRLGIRPFCINLDSRSDSTIEHIFGRGRSETLGSILRLPDLLAHLYMRYMRG